MSLKKFIKVNSKRLIGTSLLLSLMAVQSVGAAGTISDEIVSKGNIEYDANNDGTADVYFYSKDLTAIATGIDSLNTNITTLNTAMETLKETTSGYKTDIISALNSNVYSTNNISSSATFEDIIAKINAIEKKTVSQTLNPGSSYTLAAGYYTGGTVAANANTQTYTYAANSTGGTVDLGAANLYRYVNASNVYTKGKADGVASTNATATGAQVLNGYTFWANGSKLTGTMANYSSSTGQSSTTANTSNYLFVKPRNAGYYTSASSFNTGIAYNPNKTIAESSSSATATGTGTTSATTIYLDSDQKVTLPAGYYSDAQTIQNVASGGSSDIKLTKSTTFYLVRHTYNPGGTHQCNGWVSDYHCTSCGASQGFPSTAETGYTCGNQIPNGDITESYWTTDPNAANIVSSYTLSI